VESVRVVLPSGEVKDNSGKDLEVIADALGTTGIISLMIIRE